MKQIGVRMSTYEYNEIKSFGRVLSEVTVFSVELNDSELFSLLLNYAWGEKQSDSELRLRTGISDFKSMGDVFKTIFSASGKPVNFMTDVFKQGSTSKSIVLDDETSSVLASIIDKTPNRNISEVVKILCLSVVRDINSSVGVITWFLSFELFTRSMIEYTAKKVDNSYIKNSLIHVKIPETISIYQYDAENFKATMNALIRMSKFEVAREEAFAMDKLGADVAKNLMGNFTEVARGEGKFKYPNGIRPQDAMANWFWVRALPYMAVRKLFTASLVVLALKTRQNMAHISELRDSEIIDILAEKIVTNKLTLDVDYAFTYDAFILWMRRFEDHVKKKAYLKPD